MLQEKGRKMFKIPVIKLRRKTRKCRIKRDAYGKTAARQRPFDAFENGKDRPRPGNSVAKNDFTRVMHNMLTSALNRQRRK